MYEKSTSIPVYRDPTFLRDSDGLPDDNLLRRITYSHCFLKNAHTGSGKLANQEVFRSKVAQAEDLPSTKEVNSVISFHRDQIDGLLGEMEAATVDVLGHIDVAAGLVNEKSG